MEIREKNVGKTDKGDDIIIGFEEGKSDVVYALARSPVSERFFDGMLNGTYTENPGRIAKIVNDYRK